MFLTASGLVASGSIRMILFILTWGICNSILCSRLGNKWIARLSSFLLCLSVSQSVYLSVGLSVCVFSRLSTCLVACLSVCLKVCLFVCLAVYLPGCLFPSLCLLSSWVNRVHSNLVFTIRLCVISYASPRNACIEILVQSSLYNNKKSSASC